VAPITLAFRINADVPPEKCFDAVMTESYIGYCKEFKIEGSIAPLLNSDSIISFIPAYARPGYYRIQPAQYRRRLHFYFMRSGSFIRKAV